MYPTTVDWTVSTLLTLGCVTLTTAPSSFLSALSFVRFEVYFTKYLTSEVHGIYYPEKNPYFILLTNFLMCSSLTYGVKWTAVHITPLTVFWKRNLFHGNACRLSSSLQAYLYSPNPPSVAFFFSLRVRGLERVESLVNVSPRMVTPSCNLLTTNFFIWLSSI